jgi:hypothetical protein
VDFADSRYGVMVAILKKLMDLRTSYNAGNFLTSIENASLLRITLSLGVSQLDVVCLFVCLFVGRTIPQAVSHRLPPRRPVYYPSSIHVGFMVDKLALGKVSSEYFGFPCQFSFPKPSTINYHPVPV